MGSVGCGWGYGLGELGYKVRLPALSWQVNHSPSFNTDSQLDHEVKDALLCDTFNLINVHACDKKKVLEEDKRRVKERLLQPNQTARESRYCCSPTLSKDRA